MKKKHAAACLLAAAVLAGSMIPLPAGAAAVPVQHLPESDVLPNGAYRIKNLNSSKFIAQKNGNVLQESNADIWRFTRQNDGSYVISLGSFAMTVSGGTATDGNNICLQKVDGNNAQKFILQKTADQTYAILTAVSDGKSAVDRFPFIGVRCSFYSKIVCLSLFCGVRRV